MSHKPTLTQVNLRYVPVNKMCVSQTNLKFMNQRYVPQTRLKTSELKICPINQSLKR